MTQAALAQTTTESEMSVVMKDAILAAAREMAAEGGPTATQWLRLESVAIACPELTLEELREALKHVSGGQTGGGLRSRSGGRGLGGRAGIRRRFN